MRREIAVQESDNSQSKPETDSVTIRLHRIHLRRCKFNVAKCRGAGIAKPYIYIHIYMVNRHGKARPSPPWGNYASYILLMRCYDQEHHIALENIHVLLFRSVERSSWLRFLQYRVGKNDHLQFWNCHLELRDALLIWNRKARSQWWARGWGKTEIRPPPKFGKQNPFITCGNASHRRLQQCIETI